jgi:hypothetical protein
MHTSQKMRFSALLTDVMAYYGKDCSSFMLDLWWDACQNFEYEQVAKALNAHAKDAERGMFAPKVADMVRILAGTHTDRATLAWGKVLSAISSVGAYPDVVFDDPAIHASIADCGGWMKICRSDMAEISYLQHRFCQSHKAYAGRGDFEYPKVLNGDRSPDSEYAKRGLPPPKPILVGDKELAKQVYLMGGRESAGLGGLIQMAAQRSAA